MMINRNNYEEYFLLYADDELKHTERKAVEAFVDENADLREEFEFLQQMKLDPKDQVGFPGKASLYKPIVLQDDQFEPDEKQLEQLMYLDNEMEEEERLKFEQRLKTDKKLRAEFDILLNARLEPDFKVVFPDKTALYRQTERSGRIIHITWLRIAAAASVVLIAGLLWLNRSTDTDNQTGPQIARGESNVEVSNQKNEVSKATPGVGEKTQENIPQDKSAAGSDDGKNNPGANQSVAKGEAVKSGKSDLVQKVSVVRKGENLIAGNRKSNNLTGQENASQLKNSVEPELKTNQESLNVEQQIASNNLPPVSEQISSKANSSNTNISYASATNIKSNYATEALLQGDVAANDKDAQIQDDEKPRKGALRGIFRKANRIFNKVTNPDPAIPSVRVAGFEIALAQ